MATTTGHEDLPFEIEEVLEELGSRLNHYNQVLTDHGIQLPHSGTSWDGV